MRGLELSRRFYEEYGREMIASRFPDYEAVIAAGIAGEGSDCFGYDDEISRDHDFEAGFCLWIPDELEHELEFKLSRAYAKLPESYLGVTRAKHSIWGKNRRGVILTGEFYSRFTGRPGAPESLMEWLYTPEYSLACAVNGEVFRDDLGEFSSIRNVLKQGYPEDVRLKKLAARAALSAQSGQYNLERCIKRGEYGAAALALNEFVANALSMIFLLNKTYMPYYKWAFRAARELPKLSETAARLESVLTAGVCSERVMRENGIHEENGIYEENGIAGEYRLAGEIEHICADLIAELETQGLTDGAWDYLEPHAGEIMERIHDSELRNLHVMVG